MSSWEGLSPRGHSKEWPKSTIPPTRHADAFKFILFWVQSIIGCDGDGKCPQSIKHKHCCHPSQLSSAAPESEGSKCLCKVTISIVFGQMMAQRTTCSDMQRKWCYSGWPAKVSCYTWEEKSKIKSYLEQVMLFVSVWGGGVSWKPLSKSWPLTCVLKLWISWVFCLEDEQRWNRLAWS